MLIFSITTYAQNKQIITVGLNPKIVFDGAYDYSEHGNFSGTFSWVNKFQSGIEGGLAVEYTKLEPYYFTTGFIINVPLQVVYSPKIETLIGLEALYLQRGKIRQGSEQNFFTSGLNAILRWYLIDELALNLRLNGKLRPDTRKLYSGQKSSWGGFIEISYIFE